MRTMFFAKPSPSLLTRFRYLLRKVDYSAAIILKNHQKYRIAFSDIAVRDIAGALWKNIPEKLTFLLCSEGNEMGPCVQQDTVTLVRKLPTADPTRVFVNDMVVLKDPENKDSYLIRRLAAVDGHEMVSTDENDESFFLEKNECWVLADNERLKPKEAYDSRTFGPVQMTDIVGRVIYYMRDLEFHGPIFGSIESWPIDKPVLFVELDVDEMAKCLKA